MGKADYVLITNFYRLRSSSLFSFRWWRHSSSAKNGRKWWSPFQCCSPPILQLNDNKSYSTCKILQTTFVKWSYVWRNLLLESYSRVIKQAKKNVSEHNFSVPAGEHMYIKSYNLASVYKVTQRTKRECMQNWEQEIFQTHRLCSCFININQPAGNIS